MASYRAFRLSRFWRPETTSGSRFLWPYSNLDFFAVLFGILSVQTIRLFPRAIAFRWIALFSLLTAVALVYGLSWLDALPLVMLYTALYVALAYFVVLKNQAESAQMDSQFLLEELRKAHSTLQEHAVQIEELAVVEERNRLARDLHDSVTQSLYSVTLFTRAARERAESGDLEQTICSLDRASDTVGQALKHAHATAVTVRLAQPPGGRQLIFEIIDDGCGFSVENNKDNVGLGLINMGERVQNLGGLLELDSVPGQGTRVTVILEDSS